METEKANGQYGKQNPLFMSQGTAGYSIRAELHGSKGGVEAAEAFTAVPSASGQAYVTMLNAGAAIYRDEKPPVFVPGGSSPCRIESTAFYDSREMKELGLEMIKVHGSRMVGSLMTPSHTFAVFNGSVAVSSTSKALSTLRVSDYTPQYRESSGVGKRPVLTPDEVLRLPVDEALVILRGHKVLKVHKMDYSLHPACHLRRHRNRPGPLRRN